jgi:hypothetical protein
MKYKGKKGLILHMSTFVSVAQWNQLLVFTLSLLLLEETVMIWKHNDDNDVKVIKRKSTVTDIGN